jgi:ethanolamine utilization protein EutN
VLLARVTGRISAPVRAAGLDPCRLVLLETVDRHGRGQGRRYVAVDGLGAREGQLVVTTSAAAARMLDGLSGKPIDLAVAAVLDDEWTAAG